MRVPEDIEQLVVRSFRRVVHDVDDLCVVCSTRAYGAVLRVLCMAACVTDTGSVHSIDLPEFLLCSPEATLVPNM